ncbi:PAS domain S-box protein [Methanobacterium formicicum]|uniref:Signal transduction histidine kinase n=1 Tax=Methanobacterium formicicum (strain DSM 3637 / PP1) TaxID=1204725 RepID=K2R1K4_METFP|nr:PAS domain S-box protein [Methanobacterium formicicum]EKF86393.1 signal transduction histidine kinase [Methanobacterium formicicum DSM 3637]
MEQESRDDFEPLKPDQVPLEDDEKQLSIYLNRLSNFKIYSQACALIVIVLGIIITLGWFLNIPLLQGEFLGFPGSKINSAFLFIIAGVCLYLLNHQSKSWTLNVSRILAVVTVFVSVLTLLEYATGLNLGMKQLLISYLPGNINLTGQSRVLSAFNFTILGIAILMASYKYKPNIMQTLAFLSGFLALMGLTSYFYGINNSYTMDLIVQMAFLSSVIHIILSIGILCLYPDRSYMGRITAQNSGGFMARRLLPATLVAVFLMDILINLGQRFNLYSEHFSDVLGIIISMAFLTMVIIWNAKILNQMDRQRQEANLKRQNLKKFYESLVEGINEGIWVTDGEDRLYFMNNGMEKLSGVKTENMEGLHILDDLPDSSTGQMKQYYRKAKETLKPVYYDSISVTSPTGIKSYQSGWIIPQFNDGKFNGAICTVIDQTPRKKAEKALSKSETFYRTIFENTGTATIIVGEDTIITMANKRSEALSGYHVKEIENNLSWIDFVHPDDREKMKKYHKLRREPGKNLSEESGTNTSPEDQETSIPSEYEFRLLNKRGEEKQIMLSASVIPGTTDSVVSLLDITQRKNAENKVKQSLNEKELLLREIHHRVKNNMQIISSLLNLQRSHIHDAEADNILQESQGRVKSMALVHEKLYQTDNLARINVAEYIRSLSMNLFHSYTVQSGINFTVDVGEVYFNIDTAVPLGLIINELVSNSLKYAFSDRDKGEINISLEEADEAGVYHLKVSDNGTGFPSDLDFNNTNSLGLKLVNTLVQQLDGEIKLVNGSGTSFHITIHEQKYKERVKPSSENN